MSQSVVFRPAFGRALTIAVFTIAIVMVVLTAVSNGVPATVKYLCPIALVCAITFVLFWAPSVTVTDGGVKLRNVFRTIDLPWPSIDDMETRFALTLITKYGRYSAWAAPAPGRHSVLSGGKDLSNLPRSTFASGSVRPSDDVRTDSGQAALIVRRRWEELQDAGYLDDAKLESGRPPLKVHWVTIVVLLGLAIASAVLLQLP